MKYLPIFQEVFESDSIIIMFLGLIVAVLIGMAIKNPKGKLIAMLISFGIYAVCEIISNVRTNFMLEIALLFVGTIAMGAIIGFLISYVISKIRKK